MKNGFLKGEPFFVKTNDLKLLYEATLPKLAYLVLK